MQIRKVHKKCSMQLWQSRCESQNIEIMCFKNSLLHQTHIFI